MEVMPSIIAQSINLKRANGKRGIQLPLNSVPWFSKAGKVRLYADLIMYPWDFHNYSQKILLEESDFERLLSPNPV